MKLTLHTGDITTAVADAICTSTNPRLSLMMGTGGAVRDRGGFAVLRECEALLKAELGATGRRGLRPGAVRLTTAGSLPYRAVLHCVASGETHDSSAAIVRACVQNALRAAEAAGFRSLAMPVFGSGHARLKFEAALEAMLEVLRQYGGPVEEVVIVAADDEHASAARRLLA